MWLFEEHLRCGSFGGIEAALQYFAAIVIMGILQVLTHPSHWSTAVLAGYITMSNYATMQHVEGLLCVM